MTKILSVQTETFFIKHFQLQAKFWSENYQRKQNTSRRGQNFVRVLQLLEIFYLEQIFEQRNEMSNFFLQSHTASPKNFNAFSVNELESHVSEWSKTF